MKEFECLNLFYNFVYNDTIVTERNLKTDFEDFSYFIKWLEDNNIENEYLKRINETMFAYAKQAKTTKQLEHLLHINVTDDYIRLRKTYREKTHVIFFPGVDEEPFPSFELEDKSVMFHQLMTPTTTDDLVLSDPCPPLSLLGLYVDELPGVMIFTEDKHRFVSMKSLEDVKLVNAILASDDPYDYHNERYSYYIHLSDLHLGPSHKYQSVEALYESLNKLVPNLISDHKLKFLISGDLMNSPSERNMYEANDFMNVIKKHYKADVTFVLGNHDMITAGLSMSTRNKSKAVAYLLGEKIKVMEDDKLIILKIDSNMSGNFARGSIGTRQLAEIEYELSAIENVEDYTILAMLHHHVYKVTKSDFLKRKWNEKFVIGRLMDLSKALTDADIFTRWLHDHHIQYVVHGHKHVPFFMKKDNTFIVSAGSATGSLKESESKYLSYNVLKYDYIEKKFVNCAIIYRDKKDAQRLKIENYLFN